MRIGKLSQPRIPQVNLVPMMDVLMTVVTFFVILSMTLNGQQVSDIKLPEDVDLGSTKSQAKQKVKPFVLGINQQGQTVHNNQVIQSAALVKAIKSYFNQTPNGTILVLADQSLAYSKVTQILKGLRSIGGEKVSLAIQPFEDKGKDSP